MTTTRVLIKYGDEIYRCIRVETRPDGSLLIFIDRDKGPKKGAMTFDGNTWKTDNELDGKALPRGKFSCHTTGQVNRYAGGKFKGSLFIEPLHQLTKVAPIGFYSAPKVSRLDSYDQTLHKADTTAVLDVPLEVDDRLTFAFEMMPLDGPPPRSSGMMLSYEVYALVIRLIHMDVPIEMMDHFITGGPIRGEFDERQLDIARAEIGFHAVKCGGKPTIYREKSGAYLVLASVPMRIPPKLGVKFNEPALSIEQIAFPAKEVPTHKVRFWINDRGGRNKVDDLRSKIISVFLDSEL